MSVADEFFQKLDRIAPGKRGDRLAPHKPLYILFCIGLTERGLPRLQSFEAVRAELGTALRLFGKPGGSVNPQYPFWRLQNDGLAEVVADGPLGIRKSNSDPTISSLLQQNARGGLLEEYHELIKSNFGARLLATRKMLDGYFPPATHELLTRIFGIRLTDTDTCVHGWSIAFKEEILRRYNGTCAMSGFSSAWETHIIGIEASPIFWPAVTQRTEVSDAIALSATYATLYQVGLLGIDDDYRVTVSRHLRGSISDATQIDSLQGQLIRLPADQADFPNKKALALHRRWIFKD